MLVRAEEIIFVAPHKEVSEIPKRALKEFYGPLFKGGWDASKGGSLEVCRVAGFYVAFRASRRGRYLRLFAPKTLVPVSILSQAEMIELLNGGLFDEE